MTRHDNLPRVTYTNIAADFRPLHDMLDQAIPAFERDLGRDWPNRIGGRADMSGKPFELMSPLDRSLRLGRFIEADRAGVDRAVAAARKAAPGWAALSWRERVAALRRVADLIDRRKYDLGIAALIEVGKSRIEAIGEAEEAVDLVRYYCEEAERNEGFDRPMAQANSAETTRTVLKPFGVFAVIAPFNFPVALSTAMMTGALLGGNTVVFKPAPESALTGAMLAAAFADAGLPEGAVNVLAGEPAGAMLVEHPGIDGIVFTGSHAVGMEILRKAASGRFARPVIAEMGGKNPAYVSRSADPDLAAEGVMRSAFGLQGQKCSACAVAYVHERVYDAFVSRLLERSRALSIGDTRRRDVTLGPVIDEGAGRRFDAAARDAAAAGTLALGGKRLAGGVYDGGIFVAPTVATDLPADHALVTEELFLPFLAVQRFADLGEALERGNAVRYGLTAGFYGADEAELRQFLDGCQAGVLYANRRSGATTGAWPGIQSFCGWKGSGTTGKGGLGPYYVQQFMREQSQTLWRG
jgi:1-pyrroline-5-carboxylate dehydrogenase